MKSDIAKERIEEKHRYGCPLGGDEHNDCEDCAYSSDYHYVDGECIRREADGD